MPVIQTNDGTALFYNDWGTGKPVVFIHGWPLNADMWDYQTTYLADQGLRCISYDRRGFGRSSQPWSGYDYDTFADDLNALITQLELQGVTLVGFSMGGGEVARYLSRHGGAVSKAVLVSAITPFLMQTPDNPKGVERETFVQLVGGLQQDRPAALATFGKQAFGAGLLNFAISTELLQWAQSMALQGSARATVACVRAFSETDFRADLAAIRVPTLIIHGDADATVPIDSAGRRSVTMIPGAELIEYSGAPHCLFYPNRDRLNADLLTFIG